MSMNIFDKWTPVYSPEVDAGADAGSDQGLPPGGQGQEQPQRPVPINERPVDGPGSGRNQIRKDLEKAAKDIRERVDDQTGQPRGQRGRQAGYQSRATEMRDEPAAGQQPAAEAGQEGAPPAEPKEPVPEAYGRELRTSWAQVPEQWRQAILKREQDSAAGVAAIRQQYSELDNVLGPRAELIKRHGHTPAQAVNQLFSWFDALGQDPERVKNGQPPIAFIHLAKSFGLDKLIEEAMQSGQQAGQPGQQPAAGQPAGEIPPAVQQYINGLETKLAQSMQLISQKFGNIEQGLTQSQQEKTNEILAHWSQGKDYFEDVKMMMAHLLESGAVPPLEGGRADLDKAYEMAVYAVPEVRAKVLAAAEAKRLADEKARKDAEIKAQQEQANKARRASGGLAPGAPGETPNSSIRPGDRRKGKSVRESLNDAINELGS